MDKQTTKQKPKAPKRRRGGRRTKASGRKLPNVLSAETLSYDLELGSALKKCVLTEEPKLSAAIIYEKRVSMDFAFTLKDIVVNEAPAKPCADLIWMLGGMDLTAEQADVCRVHKVTVSLTNNSDYALDIRMQKPMGFLLLPSSIAMWEAYGSNNQAMRTLQPSAQTHYRLTYGSHDFMGPHQLYIGGKEALHLCSFSFTRAVIDKHGNAPILTNEMKAAKVVIGRVEIHYESSTADTGIQNDIGVQLFKTTEHLGIVDPGPVSSCTFEHGYGKKAKTVSFQRTDDKRPYMVAHVEGETLDSDFPLLDTETVYRLPSPINGSVVSPEISSVAADVIKYQDGRWRLGKFIRLDSDKGHPDGQFYNVDMPVGYSPYYAASEELVPIVHEQVKFRVKVEGKGKIGKFLMSRQAERGQKEQLKSLTKDGAFRWLPSYVTVLNVVKQLLLFALTSGVLNVIEMEPPDNPGPSSIASEPVVTSEIG